MGSEVKQPVINLREHTTDEYVLRDSCKTFTRRVPNNLAKDGLIVDIGANIGVISILISYYNQNRKVIAYEPEPHNYAMLLGNVEASGVNVECIQKGVGIPGRYLINNNSGSSSIITEIQDNYRSADSVYTFIDVISLDDVITEECAFLKIDVEGAEYDIIGGASDEVLQRIAIIDMEYHFEGELHDCTVERLKTFFDEEELGDRWYRYTRKSKQP